MSNDLERERFEAWIVPLYLKLYEMEPDLQRTDNDGEPYFDPDVSNAWTAWQARAAQPAPVAPEALLKAVRRADDVLSALTRNDQPLETLARKYGGADWHIEVDKIRSELVVQIAAAAPAQGQQVEWRTTAVMLEQANAGLAQLNGKLRAELAALKAQQEPVAWRVTGAGGLTVTPEYPKWAEDDSRLLIESLYTTPQPAPAQDVARLLRDAFMKMRNVAAGYSNYCEESASTRRLEREFEAADELYRSIPAHDKQSGGEA